MSELTGYCDHLAITPGETIGVMVHTDQPEYEASIVRLIHGDDSPAGPGFREDDIGRLSKHAGRPQQTHLGSYAVIDALAMSPSFTVAIWAFPTVPAKVEPQGLVSLLDVTGADGFSLQLDSTGCLTFICHRDDGYVQRVSAGEPIQGRCWHFVAASYDSQSGNATLVHIPRQMWSDELLVAEAPWEPSSSAQPTVPLLVGAGGWRRSKDGAGWATACFNGKLGTPLVFDRGLSRSELVLLGEADTASIDMWPGLLARWDFGADQGSCQVSDAAGRGYHARLMNMPTRGVTGHRWSGLESDFRLVPAEYDAIHFHSDDLEDAAWDRDFEWAVPSQMKSGIYAIRLRSGDLVDRIPFIVLPSQAHPPAGPILVVLPTMTYLAYANLPLVPEIQPGRPQEWHPTISPLEKYMQNHAEFGRSLYHRHEDGSGVCYSSSRRPIVSLRPDYRTSLLDAPRHLSADLYLIDWLEALGFSYDVATDGELHKYGIDYLQRYAAILTGSHPEYCTFEMLSALEAYVGGGGHLMYLGGNGFYWVTTVHQERPDVVEVRRGFGGTRPWESEPGELHHSTTGVLGGHWRRRGAIPNRLTGVGMASEGADGHSVGYRRLSGSFDRRAEFIFQGIDDDETIGDFGLVMGGAVGDEIDRADHGLGTPLEAMLLATSYPLSSHYSIVLEDRLSWRSDRQEGEARADMVYIENAEGGGVFSVGSMSWLGSLSHNQYRNNVSRITENVLRRFANSPA